MEQDDDGEEADDPDGVRPSKGEWWPCRLTDTDMEDLQVEGYIKAELNWRFVPNEPVPNPQGNERVVTKAVLERGFSFPPSEFFIEVLEHFNVQPHNISPNSITALSSYVAVCEGYLGIRPRLDLFKYYYMVKREPIKSGGPLSRTASITFKIRDNRIFPTIVPHQSARFQNGYFFYCSDEAAPAKHRDFRLSETELRMRLKTGTRRPTFPAMLNSSCALGGLPSSSKWDLPAKIPSCASSKGRFSHCNIVCG